MADNFNQRVSPIDSIVARARYPSNNLFFLDRRTADPTIKEKLFGLAETAMLFADHALRSLTFSIVRK